MSSAKFEQTNQFIRNLAKAQIDIYEKQPEELVSHFNRECSALEGYRGRQILELLQNADDAASGSLPCGVLFALSEEHLVVANKGDAFSEDGIKSLVISDCSPKQLDRNRFIGCKGLGFRSVLSWSESPLILSGDYEFCFGRESAERSVIHMAKTMPAVDKVVTKFEKATGSIPAAVMRFPEIPSVSDRRLILARGLRQKGFSTVIVLPLNPAKNGDVVYRDIEEQLRNLPTSALLFCRNLQEVEVQARRLTTSWSLTRKRISGQLSLVQVTHNEVVSKWQVFTSQGSLSAQKRFKPDQKADYELGVALPADASSPGDGRLCVFFPTEEKLNCAAVFHATLETTDDRNRLLKNDLNRQVLGQLAEFAARVIGNQPKKRRKQRALELLCGLESADVVFKDLDFVEKLVVACARQRIFPRFDGSLVVARRAIQPVPSNWQKLGPHYLGDVLNVAPRLGPLLGLFELDSLSKPQLVARLKDYVARESPALAGRLVGELLNGWELLGASAGIFVADDGRPITKGQCFFSPLSELPPLPKWGGAVRFLHPEFQRALLANCSAGSLAFMGLRNSSEVSLDEYRFETVARRLIDLLEGQDFSARESLSRWRDLLSWLASCPGDESLSALAIQVVTSKGALRRATECYLGPGFPKGELVYAMYSKFNQDEFTADVAQLGLADWSVNEVEDFLLRLGVRTEPASVPFNRGPDFRHFVEESLRRQAYPVSVRGVQYRNYMDVTAAHSAIDLPSLRLPDRFLALIQASDVVPLAAWLMTSGAKWLVSEYEDRAKYQFKLPREKAFRIETGLQVPNPVLFFLREYPWVPSASGPCRPREIILSEQAARYLLGVYKRHSLDLRHSFLRAYGGRRAWDAVLTKLGAASSLESLESHSVYALLFSLPRLDPTGVRASSIYRTLLEAASPALLDDAERSKFIAEGALLARYKGAKQYFPVSQLRYNANAFSPELVESQIPVIDLPARMNTQNIKALFGVDAIPSDALKLGVDLGKARFAPVSEAANAHFSNCKPFIYALRLAKTLDERHKELDLLANSALSVCTYAEVQTSMAGLGVPPITLDRSGQRVLDKNRLIVISEHLEGGPGELQFWISVSELVAEMLGRRDFAEQAAEILRCQSMTQMEEVVRARTSESEHLLEEACSRFASLDSKLEDQIENDTVEIREPAPMKQASPQALPRFEKQDPNKLSDSEQLVVEPVSPPQVARPKSRALVVQPILKRASRRPAGPIATEDLTLRLVAEFELAQSRWVIPVHHLTGTEGFGCDLISVIDQEIAKKAMEERRIHQRDIERYIEVKGSSAKAGLLELTQNEERAARKLRRKYWLYRVFINPTRREEYQIATLPDPFSSKAAITVIRFNLGAGSGAEWWSLTREENFTIQV